MRSLLTAGVCFTLCLGIVNPQVQDSSQRQPVFRSGTEIVHIDVSVLDRDRRPVRGLTAADFTVFSDGKPVPVVALTEVFVPQPESRGAPWLREIAPDVRTNEDLPDRRLFVIVMDNAMMPFDAMIIDSAKKIARGVIDRLAPSDLAAVVFTLDNSRAQDFTPDRARLHAAVDGFTAKFATFDAKLDWYHRQAAGLTIRKAAASLAAAPGRRKALVLIGVGAFGAPDLEAAASAAAIGSADVGRGGAERDLIHAAQQTLLQTQQANINIYGIDPSGLGGLESHLHLRPPNLFERGRRTPSQSYYQARAHRESLEALSISTGGFAVTNTNEFEPGIDQIFREHSSYYLLGFEQGAPDGRYRRLKIVVNRPGTSVNARSGYFAPPASLAVSGSPPPSLEGALSGFLPKSDLPLELALAAFASPGRDGAAVAMAVGVRPSLGDGNEEQRLEVLASAFTPQGDPRGSRRQTVRLAPGGGRPAHGNYEVLSTLTLKPGRYSVRVAIDNPATQQSGSVYHDVVIPDFRRAAVSLSGLVLSVSNGARALATEVIQDLIPVVPTAAREFGVTDDVTAFVRAYQAERKALRAVTVAVRVIDSDAATVHEQISVLTPDKFNAGAADHHIALPISSLRAGAYLLTVEALGEAGASARQHLRFMIR